MVEEGVSGAGQAAVGYEGDRGGGEVGNGLYREAEGQRGTNAAVAEGD